MDTVTSDVLHSMFALNLVEMDVSKGLLEKIFLASPRGLGHRFWIMKVFPIDARNVT